MFSVIFEVRPQPGQRDAYLDYARALRPELEQLPGFIDNILYRSLNREDWILSVTGLRDEKSVDQWLTLMSHHETQDKGRREILADYLRIGQVAFDTRLPDGHQILEPYPEETEADKRTAITLIEAQQGSDWVNSRNAEEIALYLGFDPYSYGDCISWDVFDGALSPGSISLLVSWKDAESALGFAQSAMAPDDARISAITMVRDYGTFNHREAPQHNRDAASSVKIPGAGKTEDVFYDE